MGNRYVFSLSPLVVPLRPYITPIVKLHLVHYVECIRCNSAMRFTMVGQFGAHEARKIAGYAPGRGASHDALLFLRSWVSQPLRVAAIAPSGASLAEIITRDISPVTGPVIELGAGTGAFTRKLLERGVHPGDLTLVESGDEFAAVLRSRFPQVRVLHMDATHLGAAGLFEDSSVGAVVSGLPLLSMSARRVMRILIAAFRYVRPGGAFYQFTYTTRCPIPRPILDRLGLRANLVGRTVLNVPPAAVYRISRRGIDRSHAAFAKASANSGPHTVSQDPIPLP